MAGLPIQLPEVLTLLNPGEPIKLDGIQLSGFAASAALPGQMVKLWVRLYLTSDEPIFHRLAKGLTDHIAFRMKAAGQTKDLRAVQYLLLVIHPDNTADLWVDAAAVAMQALPKRDFVAGSPVFSNDIADITAMSFPSVPIGPEDRVVCIFREGWRFGLFFDLNRDTPMSVPNMERDLGTLCRRMIHAELYSAIEDDTTLAKWIAVGWFPFGEIIGQEFQTLQSHIEAGFPLTEIEANIIAAFPQRRLDHMLKRWLAQPHYAGKKVLLESAIRSFANNEPVSVLKIVLTEIEGILNDAYVQIHGQRTRRIERLLDFAVSSAEARAGAPDTLLFPAAFGKYLRDSVFKNFDLDGQDGTASSRHAVGHGAAHAETYTMTRALQALLTLDQLCFYTVQDLRAARTQPPVSPA